MTNKFKEYGFTKKIFEELNCTGIKGEALKNQKYGYTRTFNIKEDLKITFNIIPNGREWICERVDFNSKIFSEILKHEIQNKEEFLNSGMNQFDYSMKELNYTKKSYKTVNRWAYMETKESALEEIKEQYIYLF